MNLIGCELAFKNNKKSANEMSENTQKQIVIRFLFPGTSEPEKEVAELFRAKVENKYPFIKIEYVIHSWFDLEQKIDEEHKKGEVIDLALTQDVTNLTYLNLLEDLSPYFYNSQNLLSKGNFLSSTIDYSVVDDKIYAIPSLANSFFLIVNEKMLNEVGMKIEDLRTWENLEEAARLMTRDGKYGFGYPLGNSRFAFRVPFTVAYSNGLLIDDISEDSRQKYIEVLEHFQRLEPYQPKAHMNWSYPEMFRAYSFGEIGMMAAGTFFSASAYGINPEIISQSRAIVYPMGPSAKSPQAPVSSVGLSIFKDSNHKDMAWKLIEEWSDAEFNSNFAAAINLSALQNPNVEEIVKKAEKYYPHSIDGIRVLLSDMNKITSDFGVPMAKIRGQIEMEVVIQEEMKKMLLSRSLPKDTYEDIKKKIYEIKIRYNK